MKQHITLDEVAICFCSAVAYGFGFLIPSYFGCPFIASLIICFILGLLVETVAERIIFSKFIQGHQYRRVLSWLTCIIIFMIGSHIAIVSLGEDFSEELEEEFLWLFCIPVVSLVVSFITFQIKKHRVLKKYGDGSMGYIATQENRTFMRSLNGTRAAFYQRLRSRKETERRYRNADVFK